MISLKAIYFYCLYDEVEEYISLINAGASALTLAELHKKAVAKLISAAARFKVTNWAHARKIFRDLVSLTDLEGRYVLENFEMVDDTYRCTVDSAYAYLDEESGEMQYERLWESLSELEDSAEGLILEETGSYHERFLTLYKEAANPEQLELWLIERGKEDEL